MKLVYKAVFIFLIFILTFLAGVFCADINQNHTQDTGSVIYSLNLVDNNIFNKNNEQTISARIVQGNISINNKTNGSNSSNFNAFAQTSNRQHKNIISYIYHKTYLDNKEKIEFSPLLSQIFPNAP